MISLQSMPKFPALTAAALLAAASVAVTAGPAAANGDLPAPVQIWYQALGDVDRAKLDTVLAENAQIDLRDLGIVQTKAEFLDSLDAWADANKDADILTRPGRETGKPNTVTVEVCYRFPSNELLIEETFELAGEKITQSVQQQLSESCNGF